MLNKRYLPALLISAMTLTLSAKPEKTEKNDWTLSFPETKAHFVKVQMSWAKKDAYWKPTTAELEAMFDKLDSDKDGQLSEEEWNNRKGGKPKKEKKKKD